MTRALDLSSFVLAASVADLDAERDAREHADAVEFRMDLAGDPLAALEDYGGDLPVVATNRASREGGAADDDEERLDVLAAAAEVDAVRAVDVELRSIESGDAGRVADAARVVEAAGEKDTAVVVSVHDFEGTPERGEMADLLSRACEAGDVGKLAVTATDREDALALLAVTHVADDAGLRVATMAMGEPGRHTRAVAPLYGSRIGYAPVDSEAATAPGQYDLATLARLVDLLR